MFVLLTAVFRVGQGLTVCGETLFSRLLCCWSWVCGVFLSPTDVRGADGEGDEGPARVPGAEQEDVPARAPVAGVHGQGELDRAAWCVVCRPPLSLSLSLSLPLACLACCAQAGSTRVRRQTGVVSLVLVLGPTSTCRQQAHVTNKHMSPTGTCHRQAHVTDEHMPPTGTCHR